MVNTQRGKFNCCAAYKKFRVVVGLARFELATTGLGNRCSIHLSYSPKVLIIKDLTVLLELLLLPIPCPLFFKLLHRACRKYI
jgi:hypothetical protein